MAMRMRLAGEHTGAPGGWHSPAASARPTVRIVLAAGYTASRDADLRVPVRERAPLRGAAADERRRAHVLRGVRRAGSARAAPGGGALHGIRVLHDGLL